MVNAGQRITTGRLPSARVGSTRETSDSPTTDGTEIDTITVTAPLVEGREYRVILTAGYETSNIGDEIDVRIRQGGTGAGATLQQEIIQLETASQKVTIEADFTATSTGNQTFAGTLRRNSGTGDANMDAAATRPAFLYVEYVDG